MKLRINTDDLLPRLHEVQNVINKKPMIEILRTVRMEALENGLNFTASDGDVWYETSAEVEDCQEYGRACVDASKLSEAVSSLGAKKSVMMEVKENFLTIDYDTGVMKLPSQGVEEYPLPPQFGTGGVRMEVDADTLVSAVSAVRHAASVEGVLRPILTGVCVDFSADGLVAAASDGSVLTRRAERVRVDGVPADGYRVVIPPKAASILVKSITGGVKAAVTVGDERVIIKCGRYTLLAKLLEGKFPNYGAAIPANHKMEARTNLKGLSGAIKRVMSFGDKDTGLVTLSFGDGKVTVRAEDIDFAQSAEESVDAEIKGGIDGMRVGLKASNLASAMSHIGGEDLYMELNDADKAVVIFGESGRDTHLSLLMPMMING